MKGVQHRNVINLLVFWENKNRFILLVMRAESAAGWSQEEAARTEHGSRLGADGADEADGADGADGGDETTL